MAAEDAPNRVGQVWKLNGYTRLVVSTAKNGYHPAIVLDTDSSVPPYGEWSSEGHEMWLYEPEESMERCPYYTRLS